MSWVIYNRNKQMKTFFFFLRLFILFYFFKLNSFLLFLPNVKNIKHVQGNICLTTNEKQKKNGPILGKRFIQCFSNLPNFFGCFILESVCAKTHSSGKEPLITHWQLVTTPTARCLSETSSSSPSPRLPVCPLPACVFIYRGVNMGRNRLFSSCIFFFLIFFGELNEKNE